MQGNMIVSIPLPEFLTSLEDVIRKVLSEKKSQSDEFINSNEVMKMFKISTTTLQKWRDENKIPFIRIENKIVYNKEQLLQAMKDFSHTSNQS